MALTLAQSLSKIRGAARRATRATKDIAATPPNLINISAHAELSIARADIDAAVDAILSMERKAFTRGRRRKHGKAA